MPTIREAMIAILRQPYTTDEEEADLKRQPDQPGQAPQAASDQRRHPPRPAVTSESYADAESKLDAVLVPFEERYRHVVIGELALFLPIVALFALILLRLLGLVAPLSQTGQWIFDGLLGLAFVIVFLIFWILRHLHYDGLSTSSPLAPEIKLGEAILKTFWSEVLSGEIAVLNSPPRIDGVNTPLPIEALNADFAILLLSKKKFSRFSIRSSILRRKQDPRTWRNAYVSDEEIIRYRRRHLPRHKRTTHQLINQSELVFQASWRITRAVYAHEAKSIDRYFRAMDVARKVQAHHIVDGDLGDFGDSAWETPFTQLGGLTPKDYCDFSSSAFSRIRGGRYANANKLILYSHDLAGVGLAAELAIADAERDPKQDSKKDSSQ